MITRKILIIAAALSVIALPAMAQSGSDTTEKSGHHYQGGPKTEVPHHMGKKEAGSGAHKGASGGHHYSGGPKTETHHMGEKQ